jgi:hypothetical protein
VMLPAEQPTANTDAIRQAGTQTRGMIRSTVKIEVLEQRDVPIRLHSVQPKQPNLFVRSDE